MIKRFFSDLKRYFPYAVRSASASLKAEVAGSYLNWIWWILQPICFMMIYAFIFGTVFNAKEEHFSLFIFIGLTMWNFFHAVCIHSVKIIKSNKGILSKTYLPKFVLLLSNMMVNGFKMLISFGVVIVMLIINRIPLTWAVLWIVPVLIVLFIVTFAFSMILMHLGVIIQDMNNIITILFRLLFYFTGIMYDISKRIPKPHNYWVIRVNPIACLIIQMRKAILNGQVILKMTLLGWFGIGLVLSAFGVWLVYRYENSYIKVI